MNKIKTALITGASSGIGREFAKILSENHNLVLISRNKSELEKVKLECKNLRNEVLIIDIDLSITKNFKKIFEILKKEKIVIDILINNAGFGDFSKFEKCNIEKQNEMINLNIKAITNLSYYFLNQINKEEKSYLLNIGSVASFVTGPNMSVYFATKSFVLSFSEALIEENKLNKKLSISILCPGPTKSNFEKNANTKFSSKIPEAREIAQIGLNLMFKGEKIIIPKIKNKLNVLLLNFLPRNLIRKIMGIKLKGESEKLLSNLEKIKNEVKTKN